MKDYYPILGALIFLVPVLILGFFARAAERHAAEQETDKRAASGHAK